MGRENTMIGLAMMLAAATDVPMRFGSGYATGEMVLSD
jgi:hypothetical protein